jgi:hypothetical protein
MKAVFRFVIPALSLLLCSCGGNHQQDLFQQVIKQAGLPANKKLLVVVFINPECPIAQKYTRTLNALSDSFSESTCFVGVVPGKLYDDKSIAGFKKEFVFNLPIIKDEQYALTRALGATVYPEVVLLNQQSEKLYSGKIDNWYESIGDYRPAPTEFYLSQAINSYLQKGSVQLSSTKPVGCYINYKSD